MPDGGRQIAEYSPQQLQAMPFTEALEYWTPNLAGGLPDHIPVERFKRVLITAVSINSELAAADRRSLFNACARCAHDGLYPDGREAALVIYNTKVKKRMRDQTTGEFLKTPDGKYVEREYWAEMVQYMPMIAGIRKRMRNTGQVLSADAHVIYAKDKFHRTEGDDAKIIHEPAPLDQDRGEPIGAYAIIKLANGEVLREVMRRSEIEHIRRSFSKAPDSPAWKKTPDEMWKKTVLRRCSKAAPSGSDLDVLLNREEEIDRPDEHTPLREIPPRPDPKDYMIITDERSNPADEEVTDGTVVSVPFQVVDFVGEAREFPTEEQARDALIEMIGKAKSLKILESLWDNNLDSIGALGEGHDDALAQAFTEAQKAFEQQHPGDRRQDRPAAGAQLSDPARGATIVSARGSSPENPVSRAAGRTAETTPSAETGRTEHPREQDQSSTPTERSRPRTVSQTEITEPALRDEPKSLAVNLIERAGIFDYVATKEAMLAVIASKVNTVADAARFRIENRSTFNNWIEAGKANREIGDQWRDVQYHLGQRENQLRTGEQ